MHLQHTFWLIGLAAVFALPLVENHCAGTAQPQSVSTISTTQGMPIRATNRTTGITITGVN